MPDATLRVVANTVDRIRDLRTMDHLSAERSGPEPRASIGTSRGGDEAPFEPPGHAPDKEPFEPGRRSAPDPPTELGPSPGRSCPDSPSPALRTTSVALERPRL